MTDGKKSKDNREKSENYLEYVKKQPWYDPNFEPIPEPDDWKPELVFPENHRWAGMPRCQQWISRGRQCWNSPVKGKNKCRTHGGMNGSGVSHPTYKHGRYTKSIAGNTTLSKMYQEALKQRNLLSLAPNIAMTDAHLSALYEKYININEEILATYIEMYKLWHLIEPEIPRNNVNLVKNLAQFTVYLNKFHFLAASQNEFNEREDKLTERRRKLSEAETRRLAQDSEIILKAEVVAVFTELGKAFRDLILKEVSEYGERNAVLRGFNKVIDSHILPYFDITKGEE